MSVIKGLLAGNAAYAVQTIVRLSMTAIVARLITPEEMGIWTLGFALILMFNVVRDFGTATFIQTAPDLSGDQIKACNTIQLGIGVSFFLLFVFGAEFVASFYKEPRVAQVLYVLSLGLLIMPFSSTNFNLLLRDGRFQTRTGIDFVGQMIMYFGGAVCAYYGAAHLSAPIAVIASQIVVVVICLFVRNRAYPLGFATNEIKSVIRVSSNALGTSLLQSASDRSGDFILPKTQGFGPSSIYEKGVNSLELVRVAIVDLFGSVLVSSLRSRSAKNPEDFVVIASNILYFTLLGASIGASILAINGEDFVLSLFGNQWQAAVKSLKVLAISTPFACGSAFLIKVMFLRQMHSLAFKAALVTRIGVILIVLVLSTSSLTVLAIGVVTAEICFFSVYVYLNRLNLNLVPTFKSLLIDIPIALSVACTVHELLLRFANLPPVFSFLANSLLTIVLVTVTLFFLRKPSVLRLKSCLAVK